MAKLYFYYSAMNAGKTTTLLQADHNYQERGMSTLLLSPAIDDRSGAGKIKSRIGLYSDSVSFRGTDDVFKLCSQEIFKDCSIKCVLVDEAQFLTKDQVWGLAKFADEFDIPVLTYGLRSDYMGEPFEGSKYLLAIAEELIEIKTICKCGRKATMNIRVDEAGNKISAGEQVITGGNDKYISVCRKHFF